MPTLDHNTQTSTDWDNELKKLLEEEPVKKYLHYAPNYDPYRPALCGKPAPKGGWWADAITEAKAVVNKWETCPACKRIYDSLPAGD